MGCQMSIWVVVKIMVPFGGTLNIRCRIIIGTQNGTIILTTTHLCTLCLCIYPMFVRNPVDSPENLKNNSASKGPGSSGGTFIGAV